MGGVTEFVDTRTAFKELPVELKDELLSKNYIAAHSMHHSRKLASPEYFADLNPLDYGMGRHKTRGIRSNGSVYRGACAPHRRLGGWRVQ